MATKLPSGNWRTQVLVSKQPRKFKSFIGKTAREADAKAEQWKLRYSVSSRTVNFDASASKFLDVMRGILSPNTWRSYDSILRTMRSECPSFVRLALTDIDRDALYEIAHLDKSPKTITNWLGFVSSVLSYNDIRMPRIKRPTAPKSERFVPDVDLLGRVSKLVYGSNLEVPVYLALHGLREGEICAVTADDLDGNVLHVRASMAYAGKGYVRKAPKTKASDRYVPVSGRIADLIRENGCATVLSNRALYAAFRRLLIKNNIPLFSIHDMRHAFTSIAHANGIPEKDILALGGWATSYTMQNVYRHALPSSLQASAKKLDSVLP